jgi:hypothetical protein
MTPNRSMMKKKVVRDQFQLINTEMRASQAADFWVEST